MSSEANYFRSYSLLQFGIKSITKLLAIDQLYTATVLTLKRKVKELRKLFAIEAKFRKQPFFNSGMLFGNSVAFEGNNLLYIILLLLVTKLLFVL